MVKQTLEILKNTQGEHFNMAVMQLEMKDQEYLRNFFRVEKVGTDARVKLIVRKPNS